MRSIAFILCMSAAALGQNIEINSWQPDCVYKPINGGNVLISSGSGGTWNIANLFPQVAPADWSGPVIIGALGERWKADAEGKYVLGPSQRQYSGNITMRVVMPAGGVKTVYPTWQQCEPDSNEYPAGVSYAHIIAFPKATEAVVGCYSTGGPFGNHDATGRGTEFRIVDGVIVGKAVLSVGFDGNNMSGYDANTKTFTDANGTVHNGELQIRGYLIFGNGYNGGPTPDNIDGGGGTNNFTSRPTTTQPSRWMDDISKGLVTGDKSLLRKAWEDDDLKSDLMNDLSNGLLTDVKDCFLACDDVQFVVELLHIMSAFNTGWSGMPAGAYEKAWLPTAWGGMNALITVFVNKYAAIRDGAASGLFVLLRVASACMIAYWTITGVYNGFLWAFGLTTDSGAAKVLEITGAKPTAAMVAVDRDHDRALRENADREQEIHRRQREREYRAMVASINKAHREGYEQAKEQGRRRSAKDFYGES